jgi:hypothetical protein
MDSMVLDCGESLNIDAYFYSFHGLPLPLFSASSSPTGHIDMAGSAVADIRYTWGAALIGLLASIVCAAFFLSFSHLLADLANL